MLHILLIILGCNISHLLSDLSAHRSSKVLLIFSSLFSFLAITTSFFGVSISLEEYLKEKDPKNLLLKDKMNTQTGKKIAEEKHQFMEIFLNQFYKECGEGKI